MRNDNIKKGIAFILSALMLFSAVPQAAFALDDSSGQAAVETMMAEEESDALIETYDIKVDDSNTAGTENAEAQEVAESTASAIEENSSAEEVKEEAAVSSSTDSSSTESIKEEAKESTKEKAEEKALFSEIAEDSQISEKDLNALDFSSKRLLVSGDIIDPENELSSYDGIHLMQYKDAETAKNAYSYYYGKASFVEIDSVISIATGDGSAVGSSEMSENDNPLNELSNTAPSSGGSNVIALIDTGVNDNNCVSS